jgi:plastocyanin
LLEHSSFVNKKRRSTNVLLPEYLLWRLFQLNEVIHRPEKKVSIIRSLRVAYCIVCALSVSALCIQGGVKTAYAQTFQVTLRDSSIVPSSMTGKVGRKITVNVRNAGTKVHNLVIPDFFIFTQNLKPGETVQASFTPDRSGTFPYYSDTGGKPEPGMRGTLVVRP